MRKRYYMSIMFAILAAGLYAISAPVAKLLLKEIPPAMMAALLYLGAGMGMLILGTIRKLCKNKSSELQLTKKELPYTIAMILLDVMAPILLLVGLKLTTAANASLLNNFEIVATSCIASLVFKEIIHKRVAFAIGLISIASIILSIEDISSFSFSFGSIFILLACICWGFENNCTRMMADKDPLQIVIIKGFCSGVCSLIISLLVGERISRPDYIVVTLLLGFVAYGLSIFFYVYAQRELGAAKTSAYYAVAPFIGVILSLLIFHEKPNNTFLVAFIIMIIGTYFASTKKKSKIPLK